MSDRTMAQRARDDEDHHLRMCGLLLDARDEHELEDREYAYHDFRFFASAPQARSGAGGLGGTRPGGSSAPAPTPVTPHKKEAA